jgi:guanylate kinase
LSERVPSLIVVSAPSGAGKSTAVTRTLAGLSGIRFSVSHTTRPARPGERDGREYHFVDPEAFEALVARGSFLEWAEVHGHRYGTCESEVEAARRDGVDLLLDLDVQGAAQVRARVADAVTVFILPPSYTDLERRLRGRGKDDDAAIARRLHAAREELRQYRHYDYAVVNDDLDGCVEALRSVILAARCRRSRMEGPAQRVLETFERS